MGLAAILRSLSCIGPRSSGFGEIDMPWNVWCPHLFPASHQIADAYRELLEAADYISTEQGKTSLTCPSCGNSFIFPSGWFGGAADGTGYPMVYWSRARWDRAPDLWKANAILTTPNLEQLLI